MELSLGLIDKMVAFGLRPDRMAISLRSGEILFIGAYQIVPWLLGGLQYANTYNDVIKIIGDNRTNREIAQDYQVDHTTISAIKRGKTWKHLFKGEDNEFKEW